MPQICRLLPFTPLFLAFFIFPAVAEETSQPVQPALKTTELTFADDSSWKPCHFGGDGEITMKDGVLAMDFGDPLTGVRWEGDFPKDNYEISLEARRVGGFDFFCGLTLPVGEGKTADGKSNEGRFSLILGGWGGSLVGLSNIDGQDASSNETTLIRDFKKDQWYKVKVRVAKDVITVALDGDEMIKVERAGKAFDIRSEMEETSPVGFAAFQCESEIRGVTVSRL